jgi:predicted nucleic acid-binding protein
VSVLLYLVEGNAITVESQADYLEEAFEIAITSRVTVYDALFIAQAKAKNAPLATLDDLQASAAEKLGVSLVKPHLP